MNKENVVNKVLFREINVLRIVNGFFFFDFIRFTGMWKVREKNISEIDNVLFYDARIKNFRNLCVLQKLEFQFQMRITLR